MIRSEEEGDDGLPIISNSIPARSVMGVSDLDKQEPYARIFIYTHYRLSDTHLGFLSV